jgi:hypothetical protein
MKTAFPFFILALANAAPVPMTNEEKQAAIETMDYAETGKGWKVEATANDTSSEVVIHLLQSRVVLNKGVGSLFTEDGGFPTPDGLWEGKVTEGSNEYRIGHVVFKSSLGQAAYCPASDGKCEGDQWIARQTEVKDGKPVEGGAILQETEVVFGADECEPFMKEWIEVCDSWEEALPIAIYLEKSNFAVNFQRITEVLSTGQNNRHSLEELILLVQGLKNTGSLDLIESIVPNTKERIMTNEMIESTG